MKKNTITISVHKDATTNEINEIRELFKKDKMYKDYKLNIIISGQENLKENLCNCIKAGLKA